MENDKTQKLNNTIKAVYDVLEKNKDNPDVQEAYEDAKKLMEKRGLNSNSSNS
jgi:hypothetical protein